MSLLGKKQARMRFGRISAGLGLVLCAPLLAAVAVAQEAPAVEDAAAENAQAVDLDAYEEMLVSANRAPTRRATVAGYTTVITAEDLESSVSTSLADALRFVPGLQVSGQGSRGGLTQLFLRGLDSNHVLVLIDGIRLNDQTNSRGGSFDPTTLSLADIERVEVIRGPRSSVYGSDALAGVINIISKQVAGDAEPRARLTARGGRFHTGQVLAEMSAGLGGNVGLALGGAFDTSRDPNSSGGFDGGSFKAKLDVDLPSAWTFQATTRFHRSNARSFPDSSGGPERALRRGLDDRAVREVLVGGKLGFSFGEEMGYTRELGRIELRASHSSRREDLESPGITDPRAPLNPFAGVPRNTSGDEYKRTEVAINGVAILPEFTLGETVIGTQLGGGMDFILENGESDAAFDSFGSGAFFDHRRTWGFFAELEQSIGPWIVFSASGRFDATPSEEDRFSPNVGLTVEIPNTNVTVFGSYGHGFKRPSFYALGNPFVGNDALRLERSLGGEIGARTSFWDGRAKAQVSGFMIEVENLIDFDETIPQVVNQSRLLSQGIELEFEVEPSDWFRARTGVTFNPTDFGGTSKAPENRPRWRGFAEFLVTPHVDWEMGLRVLAVGSSKASAAGIGGRVVTLNGYERLDLRVGWTPHEWISLFFEIENLTNATPREAVGFEAPGIAPRLGLTLRH
ncbi:MAG: TonB-dependent receptor plug domain-containing protein [Myxococcota bacterium]